MIVVAIAEPLQSRHPAAAAHGRAAVLRLHAVVHTTGSVRSVVARDVYARGAVVSSQAWATTLPVAEYTLAMILLSARPGSVAGKPCTTR
jgi:phosphoglycerate dehydrogenase-like enzyme